MESETDGLVDIGGTICSLAAFSGEQCLDSATDSFPMRRMVLAPSLELASCRDCSQNRLARTDCSINLCAECAADDGASNMDDLRMSSSKA